MVLLVEIVLLRAAARKWITKAVKVPAKLPKMADSTLWIVYENANPAMLSARREPRAKASFVANSDRRRVGTTIPAMNKVNATSISSRASEKTFCLFMVFAFSFRAVTVTDASSSPIRRRRKFWRMIAEDIVYPTHGRKNKVETMVIFSRSVRVRTPTVRKLLIF
jgi:hypothetical protein